MTRTRKRIGAILLAVMCAVQLALGSAVMTPVQAAEKGDVSKLLSTIDASTKAHETMGGYCLGWVATMFYRAYGMDGNVYSSCCAYANGSRYIKSTSATNIPTGALVYFSYNHGTGVITQGKCVCGNYPGHVGIYIGNDMVVHMLDTGITYTTLSKLRSSWYWYTYRGWGWYGNYELEEKPAEVTVTLDPNGGTFTEKKTYSAWSDVQLSANKPVESESCQITGQGTKYNYFHYHNSYDGLDINLDSIKYGSNWDYCNYQTTSRITNTMSFQDKGGKTQIAIGNTCKHGYNYWFEEPYTVYQYQTRTVSSPDKQIRTVGSALGTLPTPVKDGAKFLGWYTSQTGGTKISATDKAGSQNVTLYAHWSSDSESDSGYSEWSEVKTTTTKPEESDTLEIVNEKTSYEYFHYHNSYDGLDINLDSVKHGTNWGYCSYPSANRITNRMSFQDQGGMTQISIGNTCQYGYRYWFEKPVTTYSYRTRTKLESGSEPNIPTDGSGSKPDVPTDGSGSETVCIHEFGEWEELEAATVLETGLRVRICELCGEEEAEEIPLLTPTIKLNVSGTVPLQVGKSFTVKVSGLAEGDSVAAWKSSNSKIAAVSSNGKITAKKTGTVTVRVTLASGKKAYFKVKVQKNAVGTAKVRVNITETLNLKAGKTKVIRTVLTPVTSTQKITYSSSNTKVATVSSKGVIKAIGKGQATITVKSGAKKVTITVRVP